MLKAAAEKAWRSHHQRQAARARKSSEPENHLLVRKIMTAVPLISDRLAARIEAEIEMGDWGMSDNYIDGVQN